MRTHMHFTRVQTEQVIVQRTDGDQTGPLMAFLSCDWCETSRIQTSEGEEKKVIYTETTKMSANCRDSGTSVSKTTVIRHVQGKATDSVVPSQRTFCITSCLLHAQVVD